MDKAAAIHLYISRFLIAVVGLCLIAGSSFAQPGVLPVGQAEYDFIYDRLERIDALTSDKFDWQVGPYRLDYINQHLGPFSRLALTRETTIDVFGFVREDFRAIKDTHSTAFESLRGGFAAQPAKNTFVYAAFQLDQALAKDPEYNGKVWRGLAGDVEQAFGFYGTRRFSLIAGRFASYWGPRSSLLLGPHQKLDGFGYTFRLGRFSVSYRLARLDGLSPDIDSTGSFENRFFAAHRFDFHLSDDFRLGAFEAVLFGGAGRTIDLFYLNPLIFFHGSQLNEGTNDNTAVGFDADWTPARGYKLYGQLLIDDLQIDNELPTDKEPPEYGLLLGVYAADVMPRLDVKLEYSRVLNWTFNQMLARNRYLNNGRPIGSVRGNDYDLIDAHVFYWLCDDFRLSANLSHYRQGEGRILADWTAPWVEAEGDYDEPFPTGVVEKTTTLSLDARGFVTEFGYVSVLAGMDRVSNRGHIDGDDKTLPFVDLTISAFISSLVDIK